MSALTQVLQSLRNPHSNPLDPGPACAQLAQECRQAKQEWHTLLEQTQQLTPLVQQLERHISRQQASQAKQEAAVLQALAAQDQTQAHQLAMALACTEQDLAERQRALVHQQAQLHRVQQLSAAAERHYQDLCRQLTMATNTAYVRKTLDTIRQHPALTCTNAKQALADIRSREQHAVAATEAEPPPADPSATAPACSAEQVLARLQRQLGAQI